MTDETLPGTPATILCTSRIADLLVHDTIAYRGVRVMRGGLAATHTGELLGWVACAHEHDDLECPVWPARSTAGVFAQLFAGPVVMDVVYRGGDWRRASSTVNAHLVDRCGLGAASVDTHGAELAWHEVSARIGIPDRRLRLAG